MYYLLKIISILLFLLRPIGRRFLAYSLAFLSYKLFKLRKKVVRKNIKIAVGHQYSDQEQERIAFQSYFYFILTSLDFLSAIDGKLPDNVEFEGAEHVEKAKQKGKGVFIVVSHMGNWEAMVGAFTRKFGYTTTIVKKVGSDSVDRFVTEMRRRNQFDPIDRSGGKGSASKNIVKTLRKGGIIGFVMDQARPGEPKLPFFGIPAQTNTSMAYFALKYDIPVLTAYIYRPNFSGHKVVILPEVQLPKMEDEEEAIIEASKIFNKEVEKIITAKPEQYFWMHNRWK